MKKISCEACGSNELTKQGDYFICDYCHTSHYIGNENGSNTTTLEDEQIILPKQITNVQNTDTESNYPKKDYIAKQENTPRKNSMYKKIPGIFLVLVGFGCFGTLEEQISSGDMYLFLAMLSTAFVFTNVGITLTFNKKIFLTQIFSIGQTFLALIGTVMILALITIIWDTISAFWIFLALLIFSLPIISFFRKTKK
ncbi:TFIIB-type zinc finger domain-containing protein [Enterococcus sp. LJL128]